MADKNKLVVRILVLIIVLLLLAVLYAFVIRPTVTGYAIDKYTQGYYQGQADLLSNVWTQIQQAGTAQIPVGENQVLLLAGEIRQIQPAQ
ncbi:unnamed protein product [marine sediment metagenome]|uniref:Uncharacterized protein n=1 Tax=marine sediment metagenome TaxID=412755 RepID=X1VH98_9ZZZZ